MQIIVIGLLNLFLFLTVYFYLQKNKFFKENSLMLQEKIVLNNTIVFLKEEIENLNKNNKNYLSYLQEAQKNIEYLETLQFINETPDVTEPIEKSLTLEGFLKQENLINIATQFFNCGILEDKYWTSKSFGKNKLNTPKNVLFSKTNKKFFGWNTTKSGNITLDFSKEFIPFGFALNLKKHIINEKCSIGYFQIYGVDLKKKKDKFFWIDKPLGNYFFNYNYERNITNLANYNNKTIEIVFEKNNFFYQFFFCQEELNCKKKYKRFYIEFYNTGNSEYTCLGNFFLFIKNDNIFD